MKHIDQLWECVSLDAHSAAINALPGGTYASGVEAGVRAALRTAIHNGLVTVTDPDQWPLVIERSPS